MLEKLKTKLNELKIVSIHAEEILQTIEEAGMLPPFIKIKSTRETFNDGSKFNQSVTQDYYLNMWEPED